MNNISMLLATSGPNLKTQLLVHQFTPFKQCMTDTVSVLSDILVSADISEMSIWEMSYWYRPIQISVLVANR